MEKLTRTASREIIICDEQMDSQENIVFSEHTHVHELKFTK